MLRKQIASEAHNIFSQQGAIKCGLVHSLKQEGPMSVYPAGGRLHRITALQNDWSNRIMCDKTDRCAQV